LGAEFRYGLDAGAVRGWYLDLPAPERIAAGASIRNGAVGFRTWTPGPEGCGAGVARSYLLESLSGLQLAGQETVRNPPTSTPPAPAGAHAQAQGSAGDKLFQPVQHWDSADPAPGRTEGTEQAERVEQATATGDGAGQADKPRGPRSGRLGWREIIVE